MHLKKHTKKHIKKHTKMHLKKNTKEHPKKHAKKHMKKTQTKRLKKHSKRNMKKPKTKHLKKHAKKPQTKHHKNHTKKHAKKQHKKNHNKIHKKKKPTTHKHKKLHKTHPLKPSKGRYSKKKHTASHKPKQLKKLEYFAKPEEKNKSEHQHVSSPKTITFKLHGSIALEYYYINVYVGSPPQRQSVILDTGSDFTAFPCNRCTKENCGKHNNPWFNEKKSKSISKLKCNAKFGGYMCTNCMDMQCKFERHYSEEEDGNNKGLVGPVYLDNMTIGDGKDILAGPTGYKTSQVYKDSFLGDRRRYLNPFKMLFGCTINEPKMFKAQKANGIMGIAAHSNSYMTSPNIIDQLLKSKQISHNQFSLCFGD